MRLGPTNEIELADRSNILYRTQDALGGRAYVLLIAIAAPSRFRRPKPTPRSSCTEICLPLIVP